HPAKPPIEVTPSIERIAAFAPGKPVHRHDELTLPAIRPLHARSQADEGYWSIDGLPNPSPTDVVVAETHVHACDNLPAAMVDVLLFDQHRTALQMVGGAKSPGGDLGVAGPGRIPDGDVSTLLAAWNGGFQGTHAPDYGMYADGRQYRPLSKG